MIPDRNNAVGACRDFGYRFTTVSRVDRASASRPSSVARADKRISAEAALVSDGKTVVIARKEFLASVPLPDASNARALWYRAAATSDDGSETSANCTA